MKTYVLTKTYTNIYSSIIHSCQKGEQSKCRATEQWINKCDIYKQQSIIQLSKGMKHLIHATAWMNLAK